MFAFLSLTFCLFVGCFSYTVKINENSPIAFTAGVERFVGCITVGFQQPVTYQWTVVQPGNNYTFPDSNSPTLYIKFPQPQTGNRLMCQAKDRTTRFFQNSTLVNFNVSPAPRQVRILYSSPIPFRVNVTKTIECKAEGFTAISYQWINVTNRFVFAGNAARQQFRFKHRGNGFLRCGAIGSGDSSYTYSADVQYYVSGQTKQERNTLLISILIAVALAFSSLQKIY